MFMSHISSWRNSCVCHDRKKKERKIRQQQQKRTTNLWILHILSSWWGHLFISTIFVISHKWHSRSRQVLSFLPHCCCCCCCCCYCHCVFFLLLQSYYNGQCMLHSVAVMLKWRRYLLSVNMYVWIQWNQRKCTLSSCVHTLSHCVSLFSNSIFPTFLFIFIFCTEFLFCCSFFPSCTSLCILVPFVEIPTSFH